nr:hypothetical protein [uncultured Psychroserpens sp.]
MKKVNILLLSLVTLCSCSSYEEQHISEFNIDKNALSNGELVEIIYAPTSPDLNTNLEYYIKALVVSKKTNDTVNVLITSINDFAQDGNLRHFISYDSDEYKVFQNVLLSQIKGVELNETHVSDFEPKKIEKVILNKKYQNIENNDYPITIGSFGHVIEH